MFVKVSERSGNIIIFRNASFKMIEFDTPRVTHTGTVVLAGVFFRFYYSPS